MTDSHDKAIVVEVDRPDQKRMHPVVAAAMQQAPDPETLRELLKVQREWEAGEAKRAYTRALVDLHRDLPSVIERDQTVRYGTSKGKTCYTHASLAAVMDAVTEPLARHGFSMSWEPSTEDRMVTVTCRLTHCEGHSGECTISSPPDTSGSKGPAQAVASTITLLQRYTALATLGIATADQGEPHGPQEPSDPDAVDPARNMKAAAVIRKRLGGVTAAEEYAGRPVEQWTANDLFELRTWIKEQSSKPEEKANE